PADTPGRQPRHHAFRRLRHEASRDRPMSPRPLPSDSLPFEHSLVLAENGQHDEAVTDLLQLFERPDLHEQHRSAPISPLPRLARMAGAAADLASAGRAIEEALRLAPKFADLHFQHACLLLAEHRRPDARRALESALRINPRYVAARVELALLDAREGRLG